MKVFIIFALVLANFHLIEGGYYGNCFISGVDNYEWGYGIETENSVGDSYDGVIATYNTRNILEMVSVDSPYMNATFIDNTLTIFTTEGFKKFEEEYKGNSWYTPSMTIKMKFTCADNETDTLTVEQEVTDDNTHDPIFSKDVYEFHFGMSIPADYELTKIMPMTTNDKDFLNDYVYITMDYSDDIKVQYETDDYYGIRIYTSNIKTLKEIKAPYYKEFNVYSRDNGKPSRNSSARIILSVTSDGNNEDGTDENGSDEDGGNGSHPPVFAKHLYFANYTSSDNLEMEETITIKYGVEADTIIKQSGYDEYFKVALNPQINGALEVKSLQSLPDTILESTSFIVIEIEAENKDLHMPGRTALIIHLSNQGNVSDKCSGAIWSSSNQNSIALIFFLTAIFMIMVMNIVVLIWYFQKKKQSEAVRVQYPINSVIDVPPMEKIRL